MAEPDSGRATEVGGRRPGVDEVVSDLRFVLQEQCDIPAERAAAVTVEDTLASLDIDSISMAYVLAHFERSFDMQFDNDELDPKRYTTVGDLVGAIVTHSGGDENAR
jgi:acyl carrier protein